MIGEEGEREKWTTWEELLLACAVKRHGSENWESVSMEIQSRSSLPQPLITPTNCKLKFRDLNRRFTSNKELEDEVGDSVPWLDNLKDLRVAELRKEVHRYDVSILYFIHRSLIYFCYQDSSLQLKVKRLEEEGDQPSTAKTDLQSASKQDRSDVRPAARKSITGEESNHSANGSNSTGTKAHINQESQRFHSGSVKPDPVCGGLKHEDSCNESSDSIAIAEGVSDKGGNQRPKHVSGSEVHSSTSLTMKRRRKIEISGGAVEEDVSQRIRCVAAESQPLDSVLEMIHSHKYGSLFHTRIPCQETIKYNNIIRRHMDLQGIQTRLKQGCYSLSSLEFYRDLLLLFNNALVFFPKSSVEFSAAQQLRFLVSNKIDEQFKHTQSRSPEHATSSTPTSPQLKIESHRSDSLLAKHKSSVPIIVCRKRSSISLRKPDQPQYKEKTTHHTKSSTPETSQEQCPMVNRNKDTVMLTTATRSMRKSSTSQDGTTPDGSGKHTATKSEKKKGMSASTKKNKKKKGAADFLKRIRGNNSPVEKMKNENKMSTRGSGSGDQTQKKAWDQKKDGTESERVLRQSGGGKKTVKDENDSPSKRNVGRPPKKSAEVITGNGSGKPDTSRARKRSRV